MLIYEQMQTDIFSESERLLVDYMLKHPENLREMTVSEMAQKTHTNATSLVRVAKKLGFSGWRDLKHHYLSEWETLSTHFKSIDVNVPFSAQDDPATVAKKLATVEMEAIRETRNMLTSEALAQAQQLMSNAKRLLVYADYENRMIGESLIEKTRRLGLNSFLANTYDMFRYETELADDDTLAVLFSYTGESNEIIEAVTALRKKEVPTIAITSMGENTLETNATLTLRVSTHERLFSKISTFSSNLSMKYLSDLLYSLFFAANYNQNWHLILHMGERDDHRLASTAIIEERGTHVSGSHTIQPQNND
ncbi:MAG: MurR/RpiR family transcriptional regulator [Aerococcus sp.]|nr:MurR/RpiR family transcriptional regulator [Aerococcus sp.]